MSVNPAIQNQDISYVYDAASNRTSETDNGVVTSYTTNPLNEWHLLLVAPPTRMTQTVDCLAKRTAGEPRHLCITRMVRLSLLPGPAGTYQYAYDALGNIISTTHNGVVTEYITDPISPLLLGQPLPSIAQTYIGGNLASTYDYGLGLAAVEDNAGNTSYFGNRT